MRLQVNGASVYLGSGGKEFDASLPCVVFLHGSGLDHRSWALQTRWFAYNGFAVLAPDLPAHSLSAGNALSSIEQSAQWLGELLAAAKLDSVHLVGHSQGFLTALEFAAQHPQKVSSLSGVASAAAIPVNPMLIETAKKSALQAADMMLQWGFGAGVHMGASPTPGMQPIAVGRRIMANNPLAIDLQACADYTNGENALKSIDSACSMILAGQDKMTPLKAGQAAASALQATTTVLTDYGHMLPIEAPKQVLHALRDFITKQ